MSSPTHHNQWLQSFFAFYTQNNSVTDSNTDGSISADSSDEFEEVDGSVCTGTNKLSSSKRGSMSKSQVCRVNYHSEKKTVPYKCQNYPGHACCTSTAGTTVSSGSLGRCTKDTTDNIEEEELKIFETE
mmetsp:Transcript_12318/g.26216  ORF Transcript_12318/g.26216 Transcript_12318/m.26216 type:complete len:129 (-) Transcript_12318:320-706(-)